MENCKLFDAEMKFMNIVWAQEPLTTRQLTEVCQAQLGWKRTTTYTVLKRLCDRELFQNQGGTVTALVSKQQFYAHRSERFVEETFSGSLPAFIAAFSSQKKLSKQEIEELQALIDSMKED